MLLFIFCASAKAQNESIWFYPNKGQWDSKVLYKMPLAIGDFYIDNKGFTYNIMENNPLDHNHDTDNKRNVNHHESKNVVSVDAITTSFIGANISKTKHDLASKHYHNYFLGKDTSRWKGNVYGYKKIEINEIYNHISMIAEVQGRKLEYSFVISPNQDPSIIKMKIEGQQNSYITENGDLCIQSRFGKIINTKPAAWTIDPLNGNKKFIDISFKLENNILSYELGNYNKNNILFIDPEIIFSSFSGSTVDNRGFTATPDMNGNLIAGGVAFGLGYPTKSGSYDVNYNGGDTIYVDSATNKTYNLTHSGIDLTISKFNSDGKDLLFSTYIGGKGNETPHSMVCNNKNELYIFGATSSHDFPMSKKTYDNSFNGGVLSAKTLTMFFPKTDLYVLKLNESGSALINATYIGGSKNDGISDSSLCYNSGDEFRGEIIVDQNDDVIVASSTQSSNFPMVNPFQSNIKGYQDAVIFKLSPDLERLLWSSYFGGDDVETGNSVQSSKDGSIYVTGGTTSQTLKFPNGYQKDYMGGLSDGYIIKITGNKPSLIGGTFFGTPAYDQSFFVQLDSDKNVYIYGQSEGNIPISSGRYGVANSGQFIGKLTNNLNTTLWSTSFGTGSGFVDISPTAFSVSNCGDIYISGWGGIKNQLASKAKKSTTTGLEVTPDAFQSVTNGNNFYVAVLSADATNLNYATFMGGLSNSNNHVDGGTSRFDKRGGIYQAVCTGCGGITDGFSTTPGVFSETNQSTDKGCNLAAFEFDLKSSLAKISTNDSATCLNGDVQFSNLSVNCDTFFWDFGDGTKSTDKSPTHKYQALGKYQVSLIAFDSKSACLIPDTAIFEVNVYSNNEQIINPVTSICKGSEVTISAIEGGSSYAWTPSELFTQSNQSKITTKIDTDLTINVHVVKGCRTLDISFPYIILKQNETSNQKHEICSGTKIELKVSGGTEYSWEPSTYLDKTTGESVISTPTDSIVYIVTKTVGIGCSIVDTITLNVVPSDKKLITNPNLNLCLNESKIIQLSKNESTTFTPLTGITKISDYKYEIKPLSNITYHIDYSNLCGITNEVLNIRINTPKLSIEKDTTICLNGKAKIKCTGGKEYNWLNDENVEYIAYNGSEAYASPSKSTIYTIQSIDTNNCKDTQQVRVNLFKQPTIVTTKYYNAYWGDRITLNTTVINSNVGKLSWKSSDILSCTNCYSPVIMPEKDADISVYFVDTNNCSDSTKIHITFQSDLYIPNTFTPNSDSKNDVFKATGHDILDFKMDIYDRWGELIITLNSMNDFWDGTYKGLNSPIGIYNWSASYTTNFGEFITKRGHITLLR